MKWNNFISNLILLGLIICLISSNQNALSQTLDSTGVSNPNLSNSEDSVVSEQPILEEKKEEFISFSRPLSEHGPDSVLFNIVIIKNIYDERVEGELSLNIPRNWNVVGLLSKPQPIDLQPGEEKRIPVWITIAKDVIGSHTYVLIPQIDRGEELPKIKGSGFVKIPKTSNWTMSIPNTTQYFSSRKKYVPINVTISNKGNATEHIMLQLNSGNNLRIRDFDFPNDEIYIEVLQGKDTTLTFDVKFYDEGMTLDDFSEKENSIEFTAVDQTIIKKSLRFVKAPSEYKNNSHFLSFTPLSIELLSQNILTSQDPFLNLYVRGSVLFDEQDHNLSYRLNLLNFTNAQGSLTRSQTLWRYSNVYLNYKFNNSILEVGDISSSGLDLAFATRGAKFRYKFSDYVSASVSGGRNIFYPISTFGADANFKVKTVNLKLGGSIVENDYSLISLRNVGASVNFPLLKHHGLGLTYSTGQRIHRYQIGDFPVVEDPNTSFSGNRIGATHNFNTKILRINTQFDYYSPFYAGNVNNSINANNSIYFKLGEKSNISSNFRYLSLNIYQVIRGRIVPSPNFALTTERLSINRFFNKKLTGSVGGIYNNSTITTFYSAINGEFTNETNNYALFTRLGFKLSSIKSLSLYFERGFYQPISIYVAPGTEGFNPNRLTQSSRLSINYRQHNGGLNMVYIRGVLNPNQIQNFSTLEANQTLMIRPYYFDTYFNDRLFLEVFGNMLIQTSSKIENYSLNLRPKVMFNRGWSARLLLNYNLSNRELSEDEKVSNTSFFVSAGIKKEFQIQQPGVKYYDLTCIFFKDINGNGIKEEFEPELEDIVTRIKRTSNRPIIVDGYTVSKQKKGRDYLFFADLNNNSIADDDEPTFDNVTNEDFEKSIQKGSFSEIEMISDRDGTLRYEKMPEGDFDLSYYPLNNLDGLYHPGGNTEKVTVVGNTTYYIPFIEGYKVRGRVKINRDNLSTDIVKLDNIPITAVGSNGQQFKTLTNSHGDYNLMLPPTEGEYIIKVTNVFGPNFSIYQDEFQVVFNGIKTFDIEFIFDEKKRGVNSNGGGYVFKTLNGTKEEPKEEPKKVAEPIKPVAETPSINTSAEKKLWEKTDDLQKQIDELRKLKNELQDIQTQQKQTLEEINQAKDELEKVKEETQKVQEQQKAQPAVSQPNPINATAPEQTNTPVNTDNSNLDELDELIDQLIEKTNPTVNYRVEFGVFKEKMPISFLNQLIKFGNVEVSDGEGGESRFISKPYYSKKEADDYANYLKQQNIGDIRLVGEKDGKEVSVEEVDQLLNK